MRFAIRFVCILALFGITSPLFGQNPESLKHARAGFGYEQKAKYKYALFEYDTAMKLDPKFPYPVERIGGLYQLLKNYPLAITNYEHALRIDSAYDVYIYYNLGLCYRIVQKFDTAVFALREFIRRMDPVNRADTLAMKDADWWIKFDLGCIVEFAKPKNTEDPVAMADVNSKYDDFAPTLTADGNTLYFTSRRPRPGAKTEIETGDFGDALFESHRDSLGHWSKPSPLPPPLDYKDDEGSASVSADGQTLYLSICRSADGAGECDLYQSTLAGEIWSKPLNMGRAVNSPAWDGQPTVTADGNTMYFSSRRYGSMGDSSEDIYVTYKTVGGSWTIPTNLGEPVNTRFNERSPFISADGNTLYFSSNGHPGFGNHDLFMTRKLDDGTWSVPINLGRPINAYGDDVFLTIPAIGDKIIYATQRDNARGQLNLYQAKLPLEFRPGPVTLVSGTVYDVVTHKPVAAKVDVNDLKANQRIATYRANKVTGKYFVTLGTGKTFGITATADGYAPYSDSYTVPDTIPFREVAHDLPLTPIPNYVSNDTSGNGSDTTGNGLNNQNLASGGPDTTGNWLKNQNLASNGPNGSDTNGNGNKHHKHPHKKPVATDTSGNGGKTIAGNVGNSGNSGSTGNNGNSGATGNNGNSGATGNNGNSGSTGNNGNNGATGNNGNNGATGNNGNNGATGNNGNNGATGNNGNSGATGNNGNNAATGKNGNKGATGNTGATGKNGNGSHHGNGNNDASGIPLNNIFFDFDKADLKPESFVELGYVIEMLKKYPKVKIEIDGFTDSIGNTAYNLWLSEERAKAVRNYLIANGIEAKRLTAKGFGDTLPLAVNTTAMGRRQNRRTEFRFIK